MAQAQVRVLPSARNTVMVVDDQSTGRAILEQVVRSLDDRVLVESFARPVDAVVWATRHVSDLVLVDYMMPDMDGIEFAKRLRALPGYEHVPIVMVTVHDDRKVRYAALDAGITDFLTKPVDARECLARCRNLLTLRRQQLALEDRRRLLEHMVEDATREVREREKETLLRLARAGEFRDEETGFHLIRMSRYSRLIASAIGLERDEAETVELAAPLHDIGKIGIPDQILLKPGKLDDAEWEVMRRHPVIGHEILKGSASKYVRMGALIALGHHEKYDGSGYPNGLVGDHIPLCARIVAVADVYDALTTARPYKGAWKSAQALRIPARRSAASTSTRAWSTPSARCRRRSSRCRTSGASRPRRRAAADGRAGRSGEICSGCARASPRGPTPSTSRASLRLIIGALLVRVPAAGHARRYEREMILWIGGAQFVLGAAHLPAHRLHDAHLAGAARVRAARRRRARSPAYMALCGESAAPLFLIYIWVTLGSGFRFGAALPGLRAGDERRRLRHRDLPERRGGASTPRSASGCWSACSPSACTCCRWCGACSTRWRAPRRPTRRSAASSRW